MLANQTPPRGLSHTEWERLRTLPPDLRVKVERIAAELDEMRKLIEEMLRLAARKRPSGA